jgi:antitoxin (DNA-binding transcriptional repressor) of toxin-antitoxin stability system
MKIYNYSEARRKFAAILDASLNEDIIITRKDGKKFKIVPVIENTLKSPFEINDIHLTIPLGDILDAIREGRRRKV